MQTVRRAGILSALCTLSLVVPWLGTLWAVPIAVGLALFAFFVRSGPLFEILAYPGDYEDQRLYSLLTFVLAATALGFISAMSDLPTSVFVGAVVLIGYGTLADALLSLRTESELARTTAFTLGGAVAATAGQAVSHWLLALPLEPALPTMIFLGTAGGLLAALLRDVLFVTDEPIIMLAVGVILWLLAELEPALTLGAGELAVALAVTGTLGYVSYALDTASIAGMLTGVLLGLLTIVLGGYAWFAVLIAFFGLGGLSTKFRYEQKSSRGVAEENDGARGSSNVLGNSAVALTAVVGYAASSSTLLPLAPELFLFAFCASLATALSDTLSSEIGGVFDNPRLITTLEPVPPGTDGGVTWQGEVAGIAGAGSIGLLSFALFPTLDATGGLLIAVAGIIGMTVDSLLGATVEGQTLSNQGVNFFATLAGAIAGVVLAVLSFL